MSLKRRLTIGAATIVAATTLSAPAAQAFTFQPIADGSACVVTAEGREQATLGIDIPRITVTNSNIPGYINQIQSAIRSTDQQIADLTVRIDQANAAGRTEEAARLTGYLEDHRAEKVRKQEAIAGFTSCLANQSQTNESSLGGDGNVGIIAAVVAVIAIIGVVIASAAPMLAGGIPFAL